MMGTQWQGDAFPGIAAVGERSSTSTGRRGGGSGPRGHGDATPSWQRQPKHVQMSSPASLTPNYT